MTTKLRIKIGAIEIDCEGSETFLKEELPGLLSTVSNIYKEGGESLTAISEEIPPGTGAVHSPKQITGTMTSIASKLKCKSGRDLAIAACARLTLVESAESFTRQHILGEMKTASGYYKKSYSNNLSSVLQRLLKADVIHESSKDAFELTARTKQELEQRLAS